MRFQNSIFQCGWVGWSDLCLRFEFGIMKFRKGDSVEVLRRVHDPCGSWFPGTIVSVDGNDYVIRYKFLLDDEGELILEKVPGVDIRPLPLCEAANRWRVGDIAEVFDNQCWRVGKIAKVLQNNGYVVRLSGSIQLKEFHVANIRVRKSWHNSQWSVTGEVAQDKQFTTKNDSKYSLDLLSIAPSLKIGKDLPLGEDGRNDSKMYFRMGTMKRCHADYFERNSRNLVIAGSHKKRNSSTWAGGCNRPQTGTPPLFRQALYASGPLSWEQESLLTNLRLSLNISDEEHLLQLRHLLSAQVA